MNSANIILALIINLCAFAQNREIPYTREDKERLIRLEVKVEEGFERIDARFDSMEKKFDNLQLQISELKSLFLSLFLWGFGVLFGAVGLIFGYLLYERRTTISTLENKDKLLEERIEKLERELKKAA